LFKRTMLKF